MGENDARDRNLSQEKGTFGHHICLVKYYEQRPILQKTGKR